MIANFFYGQRLVQDEVDEFTGVHIKRTDAKYIAKGKKYKVYWAMMTVDEKYMVAVYLPYAVGGTSDAALYIKFKDGTIETFDSEDIYINYGDTSPVPGIDAYARTTGNSHIMWGVDVYKIDKNIINKILSNHIDKIRVVMGDNVEDAVVSKKQQEKIDNMIYLVTVYK
jgi:hypothetical protein